ncbi:acetolactate synthase large subunit [Brackiella oedipodis]|uniref:acetolactate synthase large subunit n=1 Tax=Brackiella oedipodis TaxID=124225 RepID=UPI00048C187E|nr:acetolactate synthase large subunit [Brackiella oedipodis]
MNGAKSLVNTLLQAGVDTCFANPGTSEMHFVAALDQIPGMKCVLGLQENVVTGMADGYYRVTGKAACTLLHCSPGLANGWSNIHNAHRGESAMVNIVGDQATFHRPYDAPLTGDTEALCTAISDWVRTSHKPEDVGRDAAQAVQVANTFPGKIASLILPANASWEEGGVVPEQIPTAGAAADLNPQAVQEAAEILREASKVLILLGGMACRKEAQIMAWQIAQAQGVDILFDYQIGHVERGQGRPPIERLPYVLGGSLEVLKPYDHIVLVNAKAPVGFFAYPGMPSTKYRADTVLHTLTRPNQDPIVALKAVAKALAIDLSKAEKPAIGKRPALATGELSAENVAQSIAAVIPEGTIIVDESITFGRGFYKNTANAPAHTWLHVVGGAIGGGPPLATGAAVASKKQGRRVLNMQADGSAMYTVQSLWTQAREQLPVTTVIINNSQYQILIGEYYNVGAEPGQTAMNMLDLDNPAIDWVSMAKAMGVRAATANNLEQFNQLLQDSFKADGPFLIDLRVGKLHKPSK